MAPNPSVFCSVGASVKAGRELGLAAAVTLGGSALKVYRDEIDDSSQPTPPSGPGTIGPGLGQ